MPRGAFNLDLPAISAFVAVADTGGFRAAAAALGVSSAGVSKAVARLEAELGVVLVARTTRSVRLTAAGATFHARCQAVLADLDRAGREAAEGAVQPQGRLVIGMSRAFGRLCVLPVLADYVRHYPQVEVEARLNDRPVDLVAQGVDIAVRIGHLPDSSLIATRVAETGFMLCGSPEYLASAGVPAHPDDLHRHAVVGYVSPDTAIRFTYRFLIDGTERVLNLPSQLTMNDGEALVEAATRSVGLVMVNDYLVQRYIAAGSLVRLLRAFELPPVPISVLHLPTRKVSPAEQAFTAMLRRRMASAI